MNTLFLAAAAAPATGEPGVVDKIVETFGWNPTLFFSQIVSFSVVAFLLHRFAYKPILTVLEERRQKLLKAWRMRKRSSKSSPMPRPRRRSF
jgi:F-type H+-transporting ATPase subunit b